MFNRSNDVGYFKLGGDLSYELDRKFVYKINIEDKSSAGGGESEGDGKNGFSGGFGGNGNQNYKPRNTKLAKILAFQYQANENMMMACSIMMDVLIETTEPGGLVTEARERIVDTYGSEKGKEVMEVYSKVIEIIGNIKESIGGKYMSDSYSYRMSAYLGAKVIALQIENAALSLRIKYNDINVYYNKVAPSERPKGGKFSGGGSGSSW